MRTCLGDAAADGGALPPGLYLLVAHGAGTLVSDRVEFEVTRTSLVVKRGADDALVWAADLQDGSPVAGTPLTIIDQTGNPLTSGVTGDDGTVRLSLPRPDRQNNAIIFASLARSGDVAVATQQWTGAAAPSSQGVQTNYYPPVTNTSYLYTDRPIYRTGETVHIRAVVRSDDDGSYSLPGGLGDLTLFVSDYSSHSIATQTVQLDDFGSFATDVPIPADAATGNYRVIVRRGDSVFASGSFSVDAFRVPDFNVTLATNRADYVSGQVVQANLQADFFFGAPLPDTAFTYQVYASTYSFKPADRTLSGYTFDDVDSAQPERNLRGSVDSGSGNTDADGDATFAVGTDLGDHPSSTRFTLSATITDQTRQQVSGSTDIIVHRAALYAGVKPAQFLGTAGQPVGVSVVSVDTAGSVVPRVTLQVAVFRRIWTTKTQRQPDGSTRFVSTASDTPAGSQTVLTDASGVGSWSFIPAQGGEYRIVVSGSDAAGNRFQSSTYVYVTAAGFVSWRVQDETTVKLIADKTAYTAGDVAHVLALAPFEGATGLVTIERGRVLSSRVQSFPTNSTIIDVPITADMAPTVYLSVALLKPSAGPDAPTYRIGWLKLAVSPAGHALNVTLTPDGTTFGPGDTVNVNVATADSTGAPVPAEVSLALVDEAVLSLADEPGGSIFSGFWRPRQLGVASGASLGVSINRQNQARNAAGPVPARTATPAAPAPQNSLPNAGDGNYNAPRTGGENDVPLAVRTDFKNTAYWQGNVKTDAAGKASVRIKLPDNLTDWRLDARGITADTAAGQSQAAIQTRRDVVLRPVAPRFLTAGDTTHLEALGHQSHGRAQQLDVTGDTQHLTVPAGRSLGAGWDAVAREGTPVTLTFAVRSTSGSVPGDAAQLILPVKSRSSPETVGSSGIVTGEPVQETVQVPDSASQTGDSIDASVNASLAGVVSTATDVLDGWQYEPTDMTAARLLSRIASLRAATSLNQSAEAQTAARAGALAAIQRLQANQILSGGGLGGWCWWQLCSQPSAEISARVLYALGSARGAGLTVDANVLQQGVKYLSGQYDKPTDVAAPPDPNAKAFWLLAMSEAGGGSRQRDSAAFDQRARLGGSGLAALLDAFLLDGAAPGSGEVRTLAGDITATGVLSAAGSHWEDQNAGHADGATVAGVSDAANKPDAANSTRATSLVLLALLRLDPSQPLLDGAVRWLSNTRSNGYWGSAGDTALALHAVAGFIAAHERPAGDTAFTVDVNGARIGAGSFTGTDLGKTDTVSMPLAGLPANTPVPVTIAKQSGGQLYYSLYLHYFAPTDAIGALSNGLTVSHEILPADGDAAVATVQAGDVVRVRITVVAPSDLQFVQVDDFLPAGLEAVDSSLKITDANLIKRQQQDLHALQHPSSTTGSTSAAYSPAYLRSLYYSNPFDHVEVRDDRVSLFASSLKRGVHQYIYYARATTSGTFLQPPVVAEETGFPDVFGRSDSTVLTVTP